MVSDLAARGRAQSELSEAARAFVEEARQYALGPYATALLKGQPWPKSFAQVQKELKQ